MGDLNVRLVSTQKQLNDFTKCLLHDVQALERMLQDNWFTTDPIHIGAEQEICLIDTHYKPAPAALPVLEALGGDASSFTTELAKFNIEANLKPLEFRNGCFSQMEQELNQLLNQLAGVLKDQDLSYVLTGILPTIRKFDLELENLTPLKRYESLVKAINKLRGKIYELRIGGIDELNIKHDSAMLEACNTSFQVHLQVSPDDFVSQYNIAQVLTAPVLAIATNSPMLFGKRLWNETRVALFQQSVDTRISSEYIRDRSPRVTFGNDWLRHSILELYKEDIVRFRVMLMTDVKKDALELMDEGITPALRALMIHNSTVYRWNRPCYGISPNGKPHLRIENRCLPAGPSVIDEVSNSAFWLGLMSAFGDQYPDVRLLMDFDQAKNNFVTVARYGLDSKLTWMDGKKHSASELIASELIPMAREGLRKRDILPEDIDRYMDVIEGRNETRRTGASWILDSFSQLIKERSNREETASAITASMHHHQKSGLPVHKWPLATIEHIKTWSPNSLLVEEFMTTDLFTVHKDDIPELVADIMDWQKVRYTPVEDDKGKLVGLLSMRQMLRYFAHKQKLNIREDKTVGDLMICDPQTISPDSSIIEAMIMLDQHNIGCLPVVKNGKLVGTITDTNFLSITASLLKRLNKAGLPQHEDQQDLAPEL